MSRFQENFLEIWKNTNAKQVEKIFRTGFHAFFQYRMYRNYCVRVLILSNQPRYRYYRIGIDTFAITSVHHYTPHHNRKLTQYVIKFFQKFSRNFHEILFKIWIIIIFTEYFKIFFHLFSIFKKYFSFVSRIFFNL